MGIPCSGVLQPGNTRTRRDGASFRSTFGTFSCAVPGRPSASFRSQALRGSGRNPERDRLGTSQKSSKLASPTQAHLGEMLSQSRHIEGRTAATAVGQVRAFFSRQLEPQLFSRLVMDKKGYQTWPKLHHRTTLYMGRTQCVCSVEK